MREAQGIIYIETPDGKDHCWEIAACPNIDNQKTLEKHFKTHSFLWPEGSLFVGAEIWIIRR